MRIVLDTNVLISGCWSPGGLEAQLVQLAITRRLTLCVTTIVLAEYREVARRGKFEARHACLEEMISALEGVAEVVTPGGPAEAAPDPDDNRFLECAEGAEAQWLITGNARHFPVVWRGAQVGNARKFFTANPGLLDAGSPSRGPSPG